ncbi:hypothetical protein P280DRAFT_397653 [Massarina eburnea CBS 473.64]|uniref:Uncharacterized protein n=1 Tax=Massarina eburnea CBS 473.64 TaxID=1395130 RepID=A0A6A6S3I7_9PLEO|nr:hypothetical protein P280DRAFT_397653 [Massarina eburnea CBS 473.64]
MAARFLAPQPPPRTPSPKIRIHRSQSFDSPSSRISVTPIEDSPYSKSTGSIALYIPRYDALSAAEQGMIVGRSKVMLHTNPSDDSLMSDTSSSATSATSSVANSPTQSHKHGAQFGLFAASTPIIPSPSPSSTSSPPPKNESMRPKTWSHRPANIDTKPPNPPAPSLALYQDESTPMYDPWLVRVVLDLYDIRGFEWTVIADMVGKMWGFRTCSADVLGILTGNGRIGRRWWD